MIANSTGVELLQPSETILNGQYTIEKHLGSGGRGQVYLASHRIFGQVAVKRLHPHIAAQEGLARFERELRITDQLRGDHVIFIRNFEKDPARDEWFSVMEYADTGSLEDKLAIEAPLPIVEAIELTITLCQALAPIHQYPYVHGDLKPSNILFHAGPIGKLTLKLSDFGSAFPPVQADELPLPSGLKTERTRLYLSPELLDASDLEDTEALTVGVDQRVDIYAIGVILYEMLTGRPPFWEPLDESEDMMVLLEQQHALLQKIKQQVPPEPKSQRSETLPSLNELIMKALAKAPADRFASVDEMQVRLKEVLQEERARLVNLARLRPLADQALGEKQWRQASDLLYKILNLDPGDRDTLEKLEMTENQQRLMSLRLQKIPQAMNDELWEEARKLVEEALAIDPDNAELKAYQMKIANQLTIAETLAQAREAENKEDWRTAVNLCLEAIRLDPNHAEASRLLDHTRRQLRIATLRQEAETRRQQKDKQGELETLTELQKIIPTDDEVNARIEELQRTINLETYYAQGKKAYDEKRWKAAVEALENVVAIDKFYLDAASMLLEARDQIDKELSVKLDTYHHQELQKLFDESEELIASKQWQTAREKLRRIHRDKHYRSVITKEELLARVFYVFGRQCTESQKWYQAKCCFAKVLEYTPDYSDAKQQFATARSNNRLKRNYRIKRTLGSGGTSQVDHAEDRNRGPREVSLKYLTASYVIEQEAAISRHFRRQAQRCTALDHPNIVKVFTVEMRGVMEDKQEVDVPVVVMEYIEGQNLAEFLSRIRGIPEKQAINFARQLCRALKHAHERGILHLDIKPSNILVRTDGLLKLTDFAHISHGTRGYRSPEQARRSPDLDERTDIFATGKVLYALLTGKLPIEDPLDEEDSSFRRITPPLQTVISKATADNPEDRYQSAQEMLEALDQAEAALPPRLEVGRRVSSVWQRTIAAAKTWKGVLAFIGVLLTFIVLPVLTAEDNTPLGMMLEKVITYFSGTPKPITRSIGETEFVVNDAMVEDIAQPYYVTDTRQIRIEVRVRDTDGESISDDEVSCNWTFDPPLPKQAIEEEGGCQISYQVPESLDSPLVEVEVRGKDKIEGTSTNIINIILQSDEGGSNE